MEKTFFRGFIVEIVKRFGKTLAKSEVLTVFSWLRNTPCGGSRLSVEEVISLDHLTVKREILLHTHTHAGMQTQTETHAQAIPERDR